MLWKIINSERKTARDKERNKGTTKKSENINKMAIFFTY